MKNKIRLTKKQLLFFFVFFPVFLNAQNAQVLIDNLKSELKTNPNPKRTATIYSDLTWYYSDVSLDSAMTYGKKAISESLKLGDSIVIAQAYGDVSTVYLKKGDYDESMKYLKNVLSIRTAKNDIPGLGRTYGGIAQLYFYQSKYQLSMKNYLLALEYVNKTNDDKAKNNIKNAMSGLLLEVKDYKKALLYSQESIAYFEKNNLTAPLCPMYINNGNIQIGLKDTLKAMKMYEKARIICNEVGNKLFLSKALNNIGVIKVAQKKYTDSKKLFDESKQNREEINSDFLDYKMKFNDVDVLNRAEKFTESKVLLLQLKKYFEKQNDAENLMNTYKTLVPVCSNLRENDSVAFYQTKFLSLSQKLTDADMMKKTIELETKYQTEKKEKLLLQKEIQIKNSRNQLIIVSLVALFIALMGFLFFRQQKLKNKQQEQEFQLKSAIAKIETQNKLQEQRLQISRDLHDNIGSQLTFIISSVDNIKYAFEIQNSKLDNKLSSISNFAKSTIIELRDTIWAMNNSEITFEDLQTRIHNFVEKAKEAKQEIEFNFTIESSLMGSKFSSIEGMNIYRTIQEAINNSIKYADAGNIKIDIRKENNIVVIIITDDGKGFDPKNINFGNGISNMTKRIDDLKGTLSIESFEDKGTTITIAIPIEI